MTKQSSDKVRRYQAARTRLPGIMLTTVDRANLDVCIRRHGTTAEAVKEALAFTLERIESGKKPPSFFSSGDPSGEKLQSIFVSNRFAFRWLADGEDGITPRALRQALHEYATHVTKSPK